MSSPWPGRSQAAARSDVAAGKELENGRAGWMGADVPGVRRAEHCHRPRTGCRRRLDCGLIPATWRDPRIRQSTQLDFGSRWRAMILANMRSPQPEHLAMGRRKITSGPAFR